MSHRAGAVISDIVSKVERAMLAITVLAVFLVVMATLNFIDFGRVD